MRETAIDVVLQTTRAFEVSSLDWQSFPPAEKSFRLTDEVTVGPLPDAVNSSDVINACEPAGLNFNPSRQYGYRYSFCRSHPSTEIPGLQWDEDNLLGKVLFVSRLIHPTTAAGHYAARLLLWDGTLRQIVPGPTQGIGAYSFIVAREWRDWLSSEELSELKRVLPIYLSTAVSARIRQARRHIDNAFHGFYLDQRIVFLVTAFESLLKVDRWKAGSQFRTRVPQLAKLVGETITSGDADNFYDERSGIVHGSGSSWTDLSDELIDRYQLFERTLRRTFT